MKLRVDGATLEIECTGPDSAPPVLMWHGAACTLRQWDHVVAELQGQFRLIRFDVRGAGKAVPLTIRVSILSSSMRGTRC